MVSNAAEILIVFKFAVQRMSFELLLLVTAVNSAAMKAARNKMVAGEQHCWTAGNDAACWTSVWPIAISHLPFLLQISRHYDAQFLVLASSLLLKLLPVSANSPGSRLEKHTLLHGPGRPAEWAVLDCCLEKLDAREDQKKLYKIQCKI